MENSYERSDKWYDITQMKNYIKQGLSEPDRWLLWPAFAAPIIVFLLQLATDLPGMLRFFLIPFTFVMYPASAVGIFIVAGIFAVKRHFRKAVSFLLSIATPVLLWPQMNEAVDYVHLGMTVGLGMGYLGQPLIKDDGEFVAYDWSVGLVGGLNTFLIYDKSDQIILPLEKYKPRSTTNDGLEKLCPGNVRHLLDHYYVCNF